MATVALAGPWLSPRSRNQQAFRFRHKDGGTAAEVAPYPSISALRSCCEASGAVSQVPESLLTRFAGWKSHGPHSEQMHTNSGAEGTICSDQSSPARSCSINDSMGALVAEVLPEVMSEILKHLDCEGLRKISSVCKSLRERSLSQLALAEFTTKSVTLTGLFHSFHVDALREGRQSRNGTAALQAVIEDAMSRSDIHHDIAFLDTGNYNPTSGSAGPQIRLPRASFRRLKDSLNVNEHRIVLLEGGLKKRVVCSFKVSNTHKGKGPSVRCRTCSRYGCTTCRDVVRCYSCGDGYCPACRPSAACDACEQDFCGACWKRFGMMEGCLSCPKSKGLCKECRPKQHCAVCGEHCGEAHTCESCHGVSCRACAKASSYCQKCGEFTMW